MSNIDTDIQTKRLVLQPFKEWHLTNNYVAWLNDSEVTKYSEQRHREHDMESCKAYFKSMQVNDNWFLAITTKNTNEHIGNISVTFDKPNKTADIAIMVGERKYWGKGYGLEAWQAVLGALVNYTDIRKVTAGTMKENKGMLAIMKKSGMKIEGIREKQFMLSGKEIDRVDQAIFLKRKQK